MAFQNVVSFPFVTLVEEYSGEQANQMHFGSEKVSSELGNGEVHNSYFFGFWGSLRLWYWQLLSWLISNGYFFS